MGIATSTEFRLTSGTLVYRLGDEVVYDLSASKYGKVIEINTKAHRTTIRLENGQTYRDNCYVFSRIRDVPDYMRPKRQTNREKVRISIPKQLRILDYIDGEWR